MIPAKVRDARAEAGAHIARMVDDAMGFLEASESWTLRPPVTTCGRPACSRHADRRHGEWDWFWEVSRAERTRLARWFDRDGIQIDVLADLLHVDPDTAGACWLASTRIIDADRSMRIRKSGGGYVPGVASLGG